MTEHLYFEIDSLLCFVPVEKKHDIIMFPEPSLHFAWRHDMEMLPAFLAFCMGIPLPLNSPHKEPAMTFFDQQNIGRTVKLLVISDAMAQIMWLSWAGPNMYQASCSSQISISTCRLSKLKMIN